MNNYILKLLPDGDIEITKEYELDYSCREIYHKIYNKRIYHKTYNLGESLIENLINAFEEWKKLVNEG